MLGKIQKLFNFANGITIHFSFIAVSPPEGFSLEFLPLFWWKNEKSMDFSGNSAFAYIFSSSRKTVDKKEIILAAIVFIIPLFHISVTTPCFDNRSAAYILDYYKNHKVL